MADRPVEVHVQIVGHDFLAGTLWPHRRRGVESATFRYDPSYLAAQGAYALDPSLPLVSGPLQTPLGQKIFGAFSDCAPDSWGRNLVETPPGQPLASARSTTCSVPGTICARARCGSRTPRPGRSSPRGPARSPTSPICPRLIDLADRAERDTATEAELEELVGAGGSLGGSRPKAHVADPRRGDRDREVPERRGRVGRRGLGGGRARAGATGRTGRRRQHASTSIEGRSVLIVDRFDRAGEERVGYVSAATLLETGEAEQCSYLDLAEVIEEQSDRATADLRELWRRIAFSILVSNTDDHLRNHGFLRRSSGGWSLSPAFDINPDPSQAMKRLRTSIDGRSFEASLESLFGVAEHFRVGDAELTRGDRDDERGDEPMAGGRRPSSGWTGPRSSRWRRPSSMSRRSSPGSSPESRPYNRGALDLVALKQLAADHHALDLGGALADQQQRRVSI